MNIEDLQYNDSIESEIPIDLKIEEIKYIVKNKRNDDDKITNLRKLSIDEPFFNESYKFVIDYFLNAVYTSNFELDQIAGTTKHTIHS